MRVGPELADLTVRLAAAVGLPPPRRAPPQVDWERWLDLAREHDLAPFLHARAARGLPDEVQGELRRDYVRAGHDAAFRTAELRDVLVELGELEAVVLKGAALAVTLYDVAAERPMSDVDLLFSGPEARARAVEILARRGYVPRQPGAPATDHDLPVRAGVQELELDLHINFTRPALPAEVIADAWRGRTATTALDGRLVVLDPVWRTLHAALHALNDPIGSPLLRNLFEVGWLAAILDATDRVRVVERARRFGIAGRVARAFALAHDLFGSPALLGVPPRGAWELWSWRRLGWQYGDSGHRGVVQHVAEYHLRRLDGAGGRGLDPWPLLATAFETVAHAAGSRLARIFAQGTVRRPLQRIAADVRAVGDGLLVYAAGGDVHLLEADAALAWHAAATAARPGELVARLATTGVDAQRARSAVEALRERGLLRPSDR